MQKCYMDMLYLQETVRFVCKYVKVTGQVPRDDLTNVHWLAVKDAPPIQIICVLRNFWIHYVIFRNW